VRVQWWEWDYEYWEVSDFPGIDGSVPGSLVRLSY
jgi:hypothetical protein